MQGDYLGGVHGMSWIKLVRRQDRNSEREERKRARDWTLGGGAPCGVQKPKARGDFTDMFECHQVTVRAGPGGEPVARTSAIPLVHLVVWAGCSQPRGYWVRKRWDLQYTCSLSNTGKFIQTWCLTKTKGGLASLSHKFCLCLLPGDNSPELWTASLPMTLLQPPLPDSPSVCVGGAPGHTITGLFSVSFNIHGFTCGSYTLPGAVNHSHFPLSQHTLFLVEQYLPTLRKKAFGFCQKVVSIHQSEDAQVF